MSSEHRQRLGLAEGTVVDGRYRIESELGRGGFARVYKAQHTDLGRGAALKVIDLPQQAGAVDLFIERFLREARIAANLSHPNTVTVYDYGVIAESGQPYLAMELLEGWDLEMVLAHHGPIEPQRAIGLMLEVLDALAGAQAKGIVHKDLKPSNLFLVGNGTARERLVLIDFGIARIWDDSDSRITRTGGYTGTPAYIAPEYIEFQIVTPAIDVYQCALILIEMMTGVPAVVAETSMQYVLKHCSGDVDIPEEFDGSPFGDLLRQALATDHEQRTADCATFRDALAQIDASTVPAPQRARGGPGVRHNTLENSPQTGDFSRTSDSFALDGATEALPVPEAISTPSVDAPLPPTPPIPARRGNTGAMIAVLGLAMLLVGGAVLLVAPADEQPAELTPVVTVAEPSPAVVEPVEPIEPIPVEPAAPVLEPATITSTPPGASVAIDGTVYGRTPLEIGGALLSDEERTIRVSLPAHQVEERGAVLEPGATLAFELRADRPKAQRRPAPVKAKPEPPLRKTVPASLAP